MGMRHTPKAFLDAATNIYKPIAIESEGGLLEWDLKFKTLGLLRW